MLPVVHAEVGGCEVVVVVPDEAVTERGPREEVDGDGVAAVFLGGDEALPVWDFFEVVGVGVEVVLGLSVLSTSVK